MSRLIFENGSGEEIKSSLLADKLETAGVLLAEAVKIKNSEWRLLVRKFLSVPKSAYARRGEDHIELTPAFLSDVIKKARAVNQSLIFVHTHPWKGKVHASSIDLEGEAVLMPAVFRRIPGVPHGRLVLGPNGYDGLLYSPDQETSKLRVLDVGPSIDWLLQEINDSPIDGKYDRQVRAFGAEGHRKISLLRIGIVGLGGTGSVIAQELAHLGAENFTLIDPDLLEASNLNRVVGSVGEDVGIPKVTIAAEMIRKINPKANVVSIQDSVLKVVISRELAAVDVMFSCTDTQGSRAMINYVAYQYFIPCFDMGVRIDAPEGILKNIVGRVQMIGPGLPCLLCSNLLQSDIVRRDFMTEDERRADPYIIGGGP